MLGTWTRGGRSRRIHWPLAALCGRAINVAQLAVWPEKIAKCLLKLPKNEFTSEMIDFATITKIALECGQLRQGKALLVGHFALFFQEPLTSVSKRIAQDWIFKWANLGLFFVYFGSFFKKHYNFYNKWMRKNVHLVFSAGIRTVDLSNMSLHP